MYCTCWWPFKRGLFYKTQLYASTVKEIPYSQVDQFVIYRR